MARNDATLAAARAGDQLARMAAHDEAEERGDPLTPYDTGSAYLVKLTTLYYIGRVVRQGIGWIILDDASWLHWTGRLSTVLHRGLDRGRDAWPSGDRRPRTERVGRVILHVGTQGASAYPWSHALPQENITS